jgi:hypothetical protein
LREYERLAVAFIQSFHVSKVEVMYEHICCLVTHNSDYILHSDVLSAIFASNQGSKFYCSATTDPFVQDIYFQMIRVV